MNVKRIFLIALIALAVFASVSAVSAGWFGFFDGGIGAMDNATVDIIDSSVSYKCFNTLDDNNHSKVVKKLTFNGTAKIDVSGVDQDRLKQDLENKKRWGYVKFGNITDFDTFLIDNYTIEDGVLTISFNGTERVFSHDSVEPGASGTTEVTGGYIRFYGERVRDGPEYTVTFR